MAAFLADQADRSRRWTPAKGDFIEAVRRRGSLVDADWQRYGEQAFGPALRVRPVVRAGRGVPIIYEAAAVRIGTAGTIPFRLRWCLTEAGGISPVPMPVVGDIVDGSGNSVGLSIPGAWNAAWGPTPPQSASGDTLTLRVDCLNGTPGTPPPPGAVPLAGVRVVPSTQPTVALVADPAMRALVGRSLSIHFHRGTEVTPDPALYPRGAIDVVPVNGPNGRHVVLRFDFVSDPARPWPVPVAWEMSVRIAGRAYPVQVAMPPCTHRFALYTSFASPAGTSLDGIATVDLILRPDPESAERTVGVDRIWDGVVELKDVPLVRQPAVE